MTLGNKIRTLRKERSLTQAALCGEQITRNMLSQIENDLAVPSVSTLTYLAKRLNVPIGYLLDDAQPFFPYHKMQLIDQIRALYTAENWQGCIDLCKQLGDFDDELAFLLADCYLRQAKEAIRARHLESARHLLDTCLLFTARTCYPHTAIEQEASLLLTMSEHLLNAPESADWQAILSERDRDNAELFSYLTLMRLIDNGKSDLAAALFDSVQLQNPHYRKHVHARLAASAYNFQRACNLLKELVEEDPDSCLPFFLYEIYEELENCCKSISDYEGAYRAAIAKSHLAEQFHS